LGRKNAENDPQKKDKPVERGTALETLRGPTATPATKGARKTQEKGEGRGPKAPNQNQGRVDEHGKKLTRNADLKKGEGGPGAPNTAGKKRKRRFKLRQ